jgi:deoxycytidylate deaminase
MTEAVGMSMKDIYNLNKAMGLALSSKEKHRHGAIVVKKGKVISYGINVRKNDPNICSFPLVESGVHAEVAAIKKANTCLEGATIYVARINKSGQPLFSKPCDRCQSAIEKAGIKKVIYTE